MPLGITTVAVQAIMGHTLFIWHGLHSHSALKGTPLSSGRVTHLKRFFSKPIFTCHQRIITYFVVPQNVHYRFGNSV